MSRSRRVVASTVLAVIVVTLIGCFQSEDAPPAIDISVRNATQRNVDWVKLNWSGPHVPGGIISSGITSTSVANAFPTATEATLEFVDDETRAPSSIHIPLTKFQALDPTTVKHLEFVITAPDTVEVHVDGAVISTAKAATATGG